MRAAGGFKKTISVDGEETVVGLDVEVGVTTAKPSDDKGAGVGIGVGDEMALLLEKV